MIVGIGVDLLEVERVERELRRDAPAFLRQVFRDAEVADCAARRFPARDLAARFAAKEAVLKALATGAPNAGSWREVEVRNAMRGRREVLLHGRTKALAERLGVRRISVSVSHTRTLAAAGALLED